METLALHIKKEELSSPFSLFLQINFCAWIWVFLSMMYAAKEFISILHIIKKTPTPLKRRIMEDILESAWWRYQWQLLVTSKNAVFENIAKFKTKCIKKKKDV